MTAMATSIELAARAGLARELALEAKPGLVTPSSRGSHADMDHFTFVASIDSLTGYFADCARLGACGCAFNDLQARGREAEKTMFAATGGVNTHKGAVFTMGLLSAAAGRQIADGRSVSDEYLGVTVARRWGAAILIAGSAADSDIQCTHGAQLRTRLSLPGAREQAAAGFPTLFSTTLPQLRQALARGCDESEAGAHALLATMAVLPDTNLAHRGGIAGLTWAQRASAEFLAEGSVFRADWRSRLDRLGCAFVERWLSPGGSADLLAAAWMLQLLSPAAFNDGNRIEEWALA